MVNQNFVKEWYIRIGDSKDGPFSVIDLKNDRRVTPDTLVWKSGFVEWIAIKRVPELQIVFQDPEESQPEKDDNVKKPQFAELKEKDVMVLSHDPFQFWFWFIILTLAIIYTLHQLRWF